MSTGSIFLSTPWRSISCFLQNHKKRELNCLYIENLNEEEEDDLQQKITSLLKKDVPISISVYRDFFKKDEDRSAVILGNIISQMPLLEKLIFSIGDVNQVFIDQLTRIINNAPALRSIEWYFTVRRGTNVGALVDAIGSHQNIQKVKVQKPAYITEYVSEPFVDAFTRMPLLKKFEIYKAVVPPIRIGNFFSLSKTIKHFSWVVDFIFPFFTTDILLPGLSNVTTLEEFFLNGKRFSVDELVRLLQTLQRNKNLKVLSLDYCRVDIDSDFYPVTQEIAKFSNLKTLSLQDMNITNPMSVGIPSMVSQLSNLQSFDIDDNTIFGKYMVAITRALSGSETIQEFNFLEPRRLKDASSIAKCLKLCPNMTEIAGCDDATVDRILEIEGRTTEYVIREKFWKILQRNENNIKQRKMTLVSLLLPLLYNDYYLYYYRVPVERSSDVKIPNNFIEETDDEPDSKRPRVN